MSGIKLKRLGLVTFEPYNGIDFVHVDNKDASLFPIISVGRILLDGRVSHALVRKKF